MPCEQGFPSSQDPLDRVQRDILHLQLSAVANQDLALGILPPRSAPVPAPPSFLQPVASLCAGWRSAQAKLPGERQIGEQAARTWIRPEVGL